MKIQVLGSGCPTCKKLYEITQTAVSDMKSDTTVEYITGSAGMQKIIELGVMTSPVLVVDGKVAMTGFIPNIQAIKDKILKASK